MAILKKTLFAENLERFNVLVEDDNPTSRYFGITELPGTFSGGKNAFLIQGSAELVSDTLIKIEIKDAQGNIIYHEPGEGIPEYYEGTSKVVAVYIYPDTAFGPCTITILGELKEYVNNGLITPIPTEWENQYNVRWQKSVNVNPILANTTKIRFYRRPKVDITETILPIYNRTVNRVTISGSIDGVSILPNEGSNFKTFKGDTNYELKTTGSIFSSSMEGETITITGLNQSYSTIIKDVVNSKKALATIPYYETASNDTNAFQIITNFTSASFTLPYNESITLSNSTVSSSYAKIKLTDLETFSGDVNRLKIFGKRKADIGNYTLLEDIKLESNELLQRDAYGGGVNVRTGLFTSQQIIDDFWVYKKYSDNTILSASYDNNLLAASIKLLDNGVQNTGNYYDKRILIPEYQTYFTSGTEYQLEFTPLLSSSQWPAELEVYAYGDAFDNTDSDNDGDVESGKMIGEITTTNSFQRFDKQIINFKADKTGYANIIFSVYQGNWQLSNISLRAAQETSFSPNEVTINVNVPTKVNNDTYDFKFEFYDINNNYVPVTLEQQVTFTGGTDGVVRKSLSITPNINLFSFSGSGEAIGTTSITLDIAKVGLTGSVTFVSAAFDATGGYLSPSLYSPGGYPGGLTNISDTSATLTVANFTGSLSNIKVSRIAYSASCEGVFDTTNIFRIDQGSTGADGTNSLQYVLVPVSGSAIKNKNGTLEVKLRKITGATVVDVTSGNVKIVTGSANTIVNVGNGITAGTNGVTYDTIFDSTKVSGSLLVKAYDFDKNEVVDSVTLIDVTDGLTIGSINSTNGLIFIRNPNSGSTYTPSNTAVTASFYDIRGNQYNYTVDISASYNGVDTLKYVTRSVDTNISLVVSDTSGSLLTNNTYKNTKGVTTTFSFIDPYTLQTVKIYDTFVVASDGTKGQVFLALANKNQFVYDPDNLNVPAQNNDYIDIKLTTNISGSLSITSGSYLPKLLTVSSNIIGDYTENLYRIYSGNDNEDVFTLGTNVASWSYNTPTSNLHNGTYYFNQAGYSSSVLIEGVLKGSNSKNLTAVSNANQFFYKMTDTSLYPTGQSITIDVKRNNLGSTTNTITVTKSGSGPDLTVGSNNSGTGVQSYSLAGSSYLYSYGTTTYTFTASDLNGVTYTDTITITPVVAESQVALNVSNENATLGALSTGFVASASFFATTGSLSINVGSDSITNASPIANNTFSASISSSAGVTGATITNGGIYFITSLDADSGSVKLKAVYQDGRGTQTILTKDVTYSKAKKAAPLLNISINPKAQSVSAKSTGAQVDGFSNSTVVISETYDNATTNKTITTLVANSSDIASISTTAATGLVTLNGKTLGNSTNATNVFVSASVTDSENQTRTLYDTITLSKVKKAAPTINIFASPQSQAVASNASNVQTGILSSIALSALEGTSSVFTSATVAGSSGFTSTPSISSNILTLGTIADANTQASASITINYTDSEGTTGNQQILVSATKSQKGTAGTDGAIGPGVIFRGPWASGTTYYYSTGALGRRDVVLYNAGSGDTYYGVTAQHTSTNNTNSSTGYPGSGPWQSLGTDSYFVAAKIMISEDSYVKKTLNVGTNASGNANITLYGATDKPYISIGQAVQSFGSNGIYMGVTGSAQNIVVSFASGSSYFKYNSAAAADSVIEIGGKITSTAGSIGGWSLDNGTLTGGSIVLDSINGRIIAGGLNGVVISGSAGIVAGTPLSGVRPFSVGLDGSMYASKASISGSIFATTISAQLGNIGGWCITGDGLYKYNTAGDTKVSLDSAGSQIAVVGPSSTVQIKDKLSTSFSTSGGVTSNAASAWCSINTNGAATTTFGASTLYVGMSATPGAIILHSSPQTFPNLTANATYNLTLQLKFRFKLESGYDNNSRVCTFVHGLNTTNDYYALSDYDYNPFSPNSSVGEQLYNEWIGATNHGYRYLLESGGGYENSQGDQGGGVLNAYNDLLTNYAGDSNPVLDYRNAIYGSFVPSFTISKNAFSSINTITKEIAYDTSTLSTINPTYDTTTSIPTISTIGGSAYLRPITTTDYIETSEYTLTSAITVPSTGFNTGFAISTNITNTISDAYAASYWATANYSNSGPQQSVKWDTFIETDGGSKMAKDILETDLLKVWDGENNQFIFRPYTFKYDKLYKNYYFVKVNGNEVYVSNSHNFWLENGEQINVKDLIKGVTKLFIKNGDSIIKEVVEDFYEIQSDGDEFITFSIEQYKNYLSNNIVSHNYAPIGGSGNALNFIYAVHGNLDYTCKIKNIEMQVTSLSLSAVSKFVEVTATGIQVVFDSNQTVNAFSIKGFDSGGTAITPSTSTFNLTSAGYWKHIGEIHSTGDIVGFTTAGASDERLKENIKNVTDEDYLKLKELVPVTYSWISDEEKHKHYGLIAQQVEKVFPELTRKKVFGKYMTINYIGLIPILVGMIQNQNDRIKNLENKLNGSK